MSDVFIPPAPEFPDHRAAAIDDALVRLEDRIASSKAYFFQKKADGTDRDGIQHALGTVTGLVTARLILREMRKAPSHA